MKGCLVGFTGGAGFPIFCGSLSEYRPSEYVQQWVLKWQDPAWQNRVAKHFQAVRVREVNEHWKKYGLPEKALEQAYDAGENLLMAQHSASDKTTLRGHEAVYAKQLYPSRRKTSPFRAGI